MILRRMPHALAARIAKLALGVSTLAVLVGATGCSNDDRAPIPAEPMPGTEVVGTLVAVKDDRPVDGGFDLTLETTSGDVLVRVPSIFLVPPRDAVAAMHAVVDRAKLGDRLRALGTRDETGALRAEFLELNPH